MATSAYNSAKHSANLDALYTKLMMASSQSIVAASLLTMPLKIVVKYQRHPIPFVNGVD